MRMNSNVILGIQQPDILGQIDRGNMIAAREGEANRVNQLNQLYQQKGADILAGDQGAINQLAQFSPQEALGIQGARQDMAFSAEKMQMLRDQAKQQAATQAANMTAAEREREAAEAVTWLKRAEAARSAGDMQGFNMAVAELGAPGLPPEQFDALAVTIEGGIEGLTSVREFLNPQYKPQSSEGKFFADLEAGAIPEGTTRTPSTVINNNMPGQSAWDNESAKLFAKRYDDISAASGKASELLGLYDLAGQALDTGVRTGFGAEAELSLKQLGSAMGIPVDQDQLAGGELVRAVQNRMALTMRSPDGGMGMPGALSDRDIKFLKDSQIGIDRSPEGNRKMLEAFRKIERRKIEIAALADQYIETNGRLDQGFNKVVREYAEANPLFEGSPEPGGPVNIGGYTIQEVE